MLGASLALRIVSLDSPFLTTLTDYDRRVKVKRIVVKCQLGKEPFEQLAEHTLVDGLRELVEIALVSPVVCSTLPSQKIAQGCVITYCVKLSETACTAPNACEQSQYEL